MFLYAPDFRAVLHAALIFHESLYISRSLIHAELVDWSCSIPMLLGPIVSITCQKYPKTQQFKWIAVNPGRMK